MPAVFLSIDRRFFGVSTGVVLLLLLIRVLESAKRQRLSGLSRAARFLQRYSCSYGSVTAAYSVCRLWEALSSVDHSTR